MNNIFNMIIIIIAEKVLVGNCRFDTVHPEYIYGNKEPRQTDQAWQGHPPEGGSSGGRTVLTTATGNSTTQTTVS